MAELAYTCPAPEPWAPQLPTRPRGDGGTSCSSTSPPMPIDVAALSVGLPDGVYYAGRKLTEWMSFEERRGLANLHGARHHRYLKAEDLPRYQALCARRAGESVVVRWEIEDGIPSAPTLLGNAFGDGRSDDLDKSLVKAFLWGKDCGHTDQYELGWTLISDALTNSFGDEWILPAKQVRQLAARCDLLAVAESFEEAKLAAFVEGLDADAILAEGSAS